MGHSDSRLPMFDRFASAVAQRVSHAWFFMLCVLMLAAVGLEDRVSSGS